MSDDARAISVRDLITSCDGDPACIPQLEKMGLVVRRPHSSWITEPGKLYVVLYEGKFLIISGGAIDDTTALYALAKWHLADDDKREQQFQRDLAIIDKIFGRQP